MPIFKRLLGNFLIFTTFPPEDSLGLFVCYEGHIQDVKTAEIVLVAICSRSYHKMPVLVTDKGFLLVPVDRPHWIFRGRIGSKKVRPIRGDLRYTISSCE